MHCPNSTTTSQRRRSTERADIAQLLDPSYQPSTSTHHHHRVYTDASGTIHDPEFRFFPTDEWKMLDSMRRRSFDDDDRDEVIEDDEDEYAFGGSKSRNYYNNTFSSSSSSQRRTTTTTTMSSLRYNHSSPRLNTYPSSASSASFSHYPPATPSSPAFSYTLTLPDAIEPSSPSSSFADYDSCSTPTKKKLHSRLFGCPKRYSHEIYDEDAGWQGEEEEEDDQEVPPPTPELIRDSPLEDEDEEDEESSQQQSQQSKHHLSTDLRKKWQVLQLTVQFAIFRSSKAWKRRVSF